MEQEINIEETGPDFLLDTLEHYLESSEYSDVVLISREGDQMPAHRAVITAVSGFLRQIFGTEDHDQMLLHFPDVSTGDLYAFLQLAYCGSIDLSTERKSSLISVLHMLMVSNDIFIDDLGEATRVNEIAVVAEAADRNTFNIEEEGIPDVVVASVPPPPRGSLSLSKVVKKNKIKQTVSSVPGVTVEFKAKKRPLPPVAASTVIAEHKVMRLPDAPDFALSSCDSGLIVDKQEADRITREVLDNANAEHGMNRRCERCQCPNCVSHPNTQGKSNLHVCHYASCGKKYKKTSHLRAHLRWHIGDQPFHCPWPECGKKFTRSDELHRHYRIHTGEKNHKCNICQKSFSRSDHLKKHLHSHAAAGHTVPFNSA